MTSHLGVSLTESRLEIAKFNYRTFIAFAVLRLALVHLAFVVLDAEVQFLDVHLAEIAARTTVR